MIEFIFWFSALMIFYAYFGYPLCLMAILGVRKAKSLFISNDYQKDNHGDHSSATSNTTPYVSLIITAYNEEKRIEEKIENSLIQDYSGDKLEIIIASDCSSDKTDEIVEKYAEQGVILVRAAERKGKENAQKYAVDISKGEILVFSDVATILRSDAISNIVYNFNDSSIGCVSSVDRFIDKQGNISGEGAYVKYEMFVRNLETRVNTLVGLSGSFFAARREVCKNWSIDLQSDFNTLMNSIRIGLRGVSDSKSVGYYHNISDENKEFQRKVRTVLRGISVLMNNIALFNLRKYKLFSWQLFSHKLCRWMVPYFMAIVLLTNIFAVINLGNYIGIMIIQIIFYSLAAYYYFTKIGKKKSVLLANETNMTIYGLFQKILKLFYFFIIVNLAILLAWIKYMKGERAIFWEPSKR